MNKLNNVSLENTLYMIQLARETALAKGRDQDAARLGPVVDGMRDLVASSRQDAAKAPEPKGMFAQQDFKTLLSATQQRSEPGVETVSSGSALERGRMVQAMAGANMSDVDIAFQLGMTRDEVRLILSMHNQTGRKSEAIA